MNKRRLTFKRVFDAHTYRYSEPTITARFDSFGEGETNQIIVETEETLYEDMNARRFVRNKENHFLVGEVVNRLYEYEQLGYSPEELKEIIDDRKKLKERLNSLYGTATFSKPFAETRSDAWVNTGVNIAEVMEKLKKSCAKDVENTQAMYGRIYLMSGPYPWGWNIPEIDNVIFNDPATIIFWKDGTKTVVKAEGEDFDPEKGLAMAISKKALGNKGNYFDIFKKWTKNYKPGTRRLTAVAGKSAFEGFADGMRQAAEAARKLAMETRDDAVEGNLFLASDELRGVLNRKRATKNDMVKSIRYALERLDHARLHFIKKKEN
jgi:hypothetical protein